MESNFSFSEFAMVKSSSLIFISSVPLTIKWHLSKFSVGLYSLNQLKSGIEVSSNSHKVCISVDGVRGVIKLQSKCCQELKTSQKHKVLNENWAVLILGIHQFHFPHLLKTFSTFNHCLRFDK